MSEQDAVGRLPVDTIRSRLRLEVNRFDTKMHMTNRDVSLRQTLMQAEQALEASQQENERLRDALDACRSLNISAQQSLKRLENENEQWQELGRKINEEGHEAGQGDFWVFPMKYYNTLLQQIDPAGQSGAGQPGEWVQRMSTEDIAAELSATFDLNLPDTRKVAKWIKGVGLQERKDDVR